MATLFHQFTFHLLEFLFGNDAFFLEVLQLEEFVGYGIVCALLCALYRGLLFFLGIVHPNCLYEINGNYNNKSKYYQ